MTVPERLEMHKLAAACRFISDAIYEKLEWEAQPKSEPEPTVWPVPRLINEGVLERSIGKDSTGAGYEDFYPPGSDSAVYRDDQGPFIIEPGKAYRTYLTSGAGIEHRQVSPNLPPQ